MSWFLSHFLAAYLQIFVPFFFEMLGSHDFVLRPSRARLHIHSNDGRLAGHLVLSEAAQGFCASGQHLYFLVSWHGRLRVNDGGGFRNSRTFAFRRAQVTFWSFCKSGSQVSDGFWWFLMVSDGFWWHFTFGISDGPQHLKRRMRTWGQAPRFGAFVCHGWTFEERLGIPQMAGFDGELPWINHQKWGVFI